MKKITNKINNVIETMNKQSSEILGCPSQNVNISATTNNTAEIELNAKIEHHIKQANRQTVIAAQNIDYTDYYQMCFKGEPRKVNQEIDIQSLSVNIIDSAIAFSMDNNITMKSSTETSVTYYESFTPRIFIFSFLINLILLFISFRVLYKLIMRNRG
jgi:hypothetical protein